MNTMINTKIELGSGEKKIKLKRKETKDVKKTNDTTVKSINKESITSLTDKTIT